MIQPVIIGDATLYLGNCLEVLPHLQRAGCVDAIVSDPPYGIGYINGGGKQKGVREAILINTNPIIGDDAPFDPAPWVDLSKTSERLGNRPLLLWGADHFKERLPQDGTFLCWDKSCGQGPAANFIDAEFAWMNRRNARCIYRHFWMGATRSGEDNGNNSRRSHPSQKPVELMRWCLETARVGLGKTVLDPYMGMIIGWKAFIAAVVGLDP